MKAIDFACRLLVNVSRDDMTPATRLVLLCVVAGLDTSEDISSFTGLIPSSCTAILRNLENRNLLLRVGSGREVYITTAAGRERVKSLMDVTSANYYR